MSVSISTQPANRSFLSGLKHSFLEIIGAEPGARPAAEAQGAAGDRFVQTTAAPRPFVGRGDAALPVVRRPAAPAAAAPVAKFLQDTTGFRNALDYVWTVKADLAGVGPGDPRHAALTAELRAAEKSLGETYGYTADAAPRPGAVWVAPGLQAASGQDLAMNAGNFPTRAAVTAPPKPHTLTTPKVISPSTGTM